MCFVNSILNAMALRVDIDKDMFTETEKSLLTEPEIKKMNSDLYFEKARPDKKSPCTWTVNCCPNNSPHLHNENK